MVPVLVVLTFVALVALDYFVMGKRYPDEFSYGSRREGRE